jgi:hypothetical protein
VTKPTNDREAPVSLFFEHGNLRSDLLWISAAAGRPAFIGSGFAVTATSTQDNDGCVDLEHGARDR